MSTAALALAAEFDDIEGLDAFERTPASLFLPCQNCMDLRGEVELAQHRLAKALALLRVLRRIEAKPGKPEGLDDDPLTLALIAHSCAIATVKARIDLYLQSTGQRL